MSPPEVRPVFKDPRINVQMQLMLCCVLRGTPPRSEIGSDMPKGFESGEHTARKMGLESLSFDLSPRLNTPERRTLIIQ
ncbi:hypothetical protein CEXT_206011 [Caerostris extrusa]|uniref:Uncharacterized protein n=1 Tax=Caerostris extrusa TaxID=172846 RepID=A0AAV4TRA3_CAEEX|nr:hypothetical protein CEXT_206011 [Caerostris extrusa]